jgi:DNA uptake protein ComE-like DNA-binding protein
VDLNTASLEALTGLVGVEHAYDLMLGRPFIHWDEVAAVPGFDHGAVAALRAIGAQINLPDDPRSFRPALGLAP